MQLPFSFARRIMKGRPFNPGSRLKNDGVYAILRIQK